jgi:hypothetical protein
VRGSVTRSNLRKREGAQLKLERLEHLQLLRVTDPRSVTSGA